MKPAEPSDPVDAVAHSSFASRMASYVAGGLRYWEPRRLVYNGVLAVVVLVVFGIGWPESRKLLTFDLMLALIFLAVLANIAYCVAYVGDLFLQFSGLDVAVRWGRTILFAIGIVFASTITIVFARGMFNV